MKALVAIAFALAAMVAASRADVMPNDGFRRDDAEDAVRGPKVRIKDLVEFEGVRGNDLVGYGLVVGLAGTGDALRNAPFTEEALANLLERLGINVSGESFRPKNVAAVLVTGSLPPFARAGGRIDVTVSAIGDAKSLRGGTLVMTPLNAADGEIYAVAQGSIIAGGLLAEGDAASVMQGVPTAGTIPSGARVEREIDFDFQSLNSIRLALREPDFTTAMRISRAINRTLGAKVASTLDSGTVELRLDQSPMSPAELISRIESAVVTPDVKARVVVDQRSGTVVLGSDVTVSRVAITQGGLTVRINEKPSVVQPNPFSRNAETIVVPRTDVTVNQADGGGLVMLDDSVELSDVVEGLNSLGVDPDGMVKILMSIKAAGALHAEFIVQ